MVGEAVSVPSIIRPAARTFPRGVRFEQASFALLRSEPASPLSFYLFKKAHHWAERSFLILSAPGYVWVRRLRKSFLLALADLGQSSVNKLD
jgi:hypothetical protein